MSWSESGYIISELTSVIEGHGGGDKSNSDIRVDATATVTTTNRTVSKSIAVVAGDGALSVLNSDETVCTATLSGYNISITGIKPGTATLTVVINETENYYGSIATMTVTSTAVKIVTWAGGSTAEVKAMVDAADAGDINLYDYWSQGQEKTFTLGAIASDSDLDNSTDGANPSQQITMALMDTGANLDVYYPSNDYYKLVTVPASGRKRPWFLVGMKNNLSCRGKMNATNTNSGSWNSAPRRTWCNNNFKAAIPSDMVGMFKQAKTPTINEYNGSSITLSADYFAFWAEKEAQGSRTYSNTTEANALHIIKYYETASNKVKKNGGVDSAQASGGNWWWNRSPYSDNATYFCAVYDDGSASYTNANDETGGLSPFGYI